MLSIVEVLSQEILDCVLDYFGSQNGGFDWEDSWWAALPTLKACSLVCKRFRHRSQYHIFTLIRLYDSSGPRAITLKQRSAGLCGLLSARPELARGPRHVTIAFHRETLLFQTKDTASRDVHTLVSKEVAAILKSFVKAGASITTLSIATPAVEAHYSLRKKSEIQESDEELGSCIDLAAVTCLIVRANRLPISIISRTVNLKDLWMYNGGVHSVATQDRITSLKIPVIQNLKLGGSSIPSLGALLDSTTLLDLHSLRSLDIDPTGDFPERFSSYLPNIQHLRLDHGLEALLPADRSQCLKFSSFKNLQTLYIEFDLDKTPFPQPPPLFFNHLRHCLVKLPARNLESVHLRFRVYPQLFQRSDLIRGYPWPTLWDALEQMFKRIGTCEIRVDFVERFWPVDGVDVKTPTPSPAVDIFLRGQSKDFRSAILETRCTLTHTLQVGTNEIITYSI